MADADASSNRSEEDLMQNPFLRALRSVYEELYRRAVEGGDATLLLLPHAGALAGVIITQIFAETHVLRAAGAPGFFMNLCGQGIEIKEQQSATTHLGFIEHRVCDVIQTESMYDFGNTFRVFVIDKPLIGKYRQPREAITRATAGYAAASHLRLSPSGALPTLDVPAEWLSTAPAISDSLFEAVDRFRRTFVQVPGCEQSTAERIREIVSNAVQSLIKFHSLTEPGQQRRLEFHVSRNTYAALHSFIFPHLLRILAGAEERLSAAIQRVSGADELIGSIPGSHGCGLGAVDLRECSAQLASVDHLITPHEKITAINAAHSSLQRCVAESAARPRAPGAELQGGLSVRERIEITGDDVLSLFILAVHGSRDWRNRLAHVAHVEMYLQGAAGRSGGEAARFEEAGYAVSALQAALQFFLDTQPPPPLTTTRDISQRVSLDHLL